MSKDSTFEEQLERVKEITGCSTQSALATFFGTSQSSISSMCSKRRISATLLVKLVEKKRVNPTWVKTGKGIKRFGLQELKKTPHEIAGMLLQDPDILSHVPSSLLIKELYKRSDELQGKYDSHVKLPAGDILS